MDLIYTNAKRTDQGVLSTHAFDLSYGASENNFELTIGANEPMLETDACIYIEGTEYGGTVGGIKSSTYGETITYKGRTWHGILNSKVILPLKNGESVEKPLRKLPKGYKELDYIETTGTQWIDTGFIPNQDSRIVCEFMYGGSGNGVYGTRTSTASNNFAMRVINGAWQPGYRTVLGSTGIAADATDWHIADQNKNLFYVDGVLFYEFEYATFTAPKSIALGGINANNKFYYGSAKYRNCQIYDNGVLVRDLIPCQNPKGDAGMYDTLNNKFYSNAGTGVFLTGEVNETVDVVIKGNDANGNSLVGSYLVISGDANDCIAFILNRLGLSGLFVAAENPSGVNISNYKFHRYCKGYDGVADMLADNGGKLKIAWKDRAVHLSAEPIGDYTESPVDGDIATLTVEQNKDKVNHLICLGKGDLAAREVIHLYVDQFGRIGDVQYYTGIDEIVDTYDNSNTDDLRSDGIKHFKELRNNDKAEISLSESDGLTYDIGDIVGAKEYKSGVSVSAVVTQKIVKIYNGVVSTEYKTSG